MKKHSFFFVAIYKRDVTLLSLGKFINLRNLDKKSYLYVFKKH